MAEQSNFTVGGYYFDSLTDAQIAEEERKKAEYFEERLSGRTAQNILAIYDKVLDEKVFVTPIGWEYLKYLQSRLREEGIPPERIRPIPLYHTFSFEHASGKEHRGIAKEYIRPSVKKQRTQKAKLRISVIANVILVFLVVAMFIITMKGENVNAINYRSAIINEYASWEKELTERENAVREKEAELSIPEEPK